MANQKAKSSSIPRREVLVRHRRPRVNKKRTSGLSAGNVSDQLYVLGTLIERNRKNLWRGLRSGAKTVFAAVFGAFATVFGAIGRALAGIWNDLTAPFKKMRRSFKSLFAILRSTKGRGAGYRRDRVRLFFKYGWMWNKHLVGRLLNYMLPAVSLILCFVVVFTMSNLNYALKVTYNGETVGYIENESVYDSARRIIKSRMIVGSDQDILNNDTELSIAVVHTSDLSTQDVMAESLLSASGSEIANATGIFIGGVLYGATTAPALLEEKLEELQSPFYAVAAQLGDDATVRFAREVRLEEGVYPVSSIVPIEALIEKVASPTPGDIYYTVTGRETLSEVALQNGISMGMLLLLNPSLEESQALESGDKLLVARGEVLLRVKTVRNVTQTESVAYSTTRISDPNQSNRNYQIVQSGVPGERTIVKEIEYDATGNVVFENVISDEITTPPINQQIVVGTQNTGAVSQTLLDWPTGPGYYISRGFRPVASSGLSAHYGVDIANGYRTPIYAAESGTVVLALYTSVGYGVYVIIDHGNGMQTLYAHCSTLLVSRGDRVSRGQLIALMGSTGNSTGNHLHFEVRIDDERVAPEPFIGLSES